MLSCSLGDIFNVGCGYGRPDGIEINDLVATYGGPDTGTITLRKDGTFSAKDLRKKHHDDDEVELLSGHGTWSLNERGNRTRRLEDYSDIALTFEASDGTTSTWTRIDIGGSEVGYASRSPGRSSTGTATSSSGEYGFDVWLYYLSGDFSSCDIVKLDRHDPGARRSPTDRPGPGHLPRPATTFAPATPSVHPSPT
jgi:hypothetical protein